MNYFENAPMGNLVFDRTYARTKDDGTKESWADCVSRVVQGNLALVPEEYHEPGEAGLLHEMILNKKILPAGRHLWVGGVPGRQFLFNCHRAGWPTINEHFCFTFDELMKGGGVGANYSSSYLEGLPALPGKVDVYFTCSPYHPDYQDMPGIDADAYNAIKVPDTREGWVDCLRHLLEVAQESGHHDVGFDVSQVREKGQPIRGFGGIASGPVPLMNMLLRVAELLNTIERLDPISAMEIDHEVAACVIAGNVRRSARMSILHWNDPYIEQFLTCKSDPMKHWTTNISVEVDDDYFRAGQPLNNRIADGMLTNGEPGVFNSSMASRGEIGDVRCTNPCGEIALEDMEPCNLGHVNLAACKPEERTEAFRLMARFLLRATYGDVQNPRQQEILRRNRRIGVGFFGLQEFLCQNGIRMSEATGSNWFRTELSLWKATVRREADRYSRRLGIPSPIKVTTVAPTGTISKLAGTSEGIHPIHSKYFIRRIRFADNDPTIPKEYPSEPCLYSAHTTVVSIPSRDPLLDRVDPDLIEQACDIPMMNMLTLQHLIQENYADNAISHTVNVEPGFSVDELVDNLDTFIPVLKGMTVMVDESRPQAPYERICKPEYEELNGKEVAQVEEECKGAVCPVR